MGENGGRPRNQPGQDEAAITEEALKKAEEYIEEEEGATNRLGGSLGTFVVAVAVIMSLFHLYAAVTIMPTHVLRGIHVAFVLFLVFLLFPIAKRLRNRVYWWDWINSALALAVMGYMLFGGDDFLERSTAPTMLDQIAGVLLIVLVLEAVRRCSGWIMPFIVVLFLVYAFVGAHLPPPWTHHGMDVGRVVGHMYMTLEGIFGVPVDVSSSLIIMFTIYGAFLQYSGAGKFFIDFSFAAMGGRPAGAGRTIVLASFLLGGPSGSGVATTVTLGSVAYPLLVKAGYGKDAAGGLLAAGGLGAIISPPVLGAAAFLIAEFLKISYLDVILMATIPTLLYYFALFLMVEIDARKFGMKRVDIAAADTMWNLTKQFGFHFLSLVAIIVFMLLGFSPILSVFWATVVALVMSFLHPACALIPYDVFRGKGPIVRQLWESGFIKALEGGSVGVLNVAATCAAAGIIVGVVTLTGLGLKFSSIMLQYADSGSRGIMDLLTAMSVAPTPALLHDVKLLLTAIFTSLIVWVVGLAVPVTASYIICAVIAAPALIQLGVADFAAHMFIFYYAVLSEVSPPTALSPFAAAAITGGDPYKTTLQSWKYTMPAFLVPFVFVLDPAGLGLLLMGSFKKLASAPWLDLATVSITAMIGIAALAGGVQGWLFKKTTSLERWLLIIAGLALVYPKALLDYIGVALIIIAIVLQKLRRAEPPPATG
jgi:TRAP transporter 4TM/12TM fusion protein